MNIPYTFGVVRYVHDVVSAEFVNVGVIVYAPEARYLDVRCTHKYARLSHLFLEVDGEHFRRLMTHVEMRIQAAASQLRHDLQFAPVPTDVAGVIREQFVVDESSLQIVMVGGGVARDPVSALDELYHRYVERYYRAQKHTGRSDSEVWHHYQRSLRNAGVLPKLRQRTIIAPDLEYTFEHCWRNGEDRAMEPMSLDYANEDSIQEKANRWLGMMYNLAESRERFHVTFLLGEPTLDRLRPVFQRAQNILNKAPLSKDFIREDEAESFARDVKEQIEAREHGETAE